MNTEILTAALNVLHSIEVLKNNGFDWDTFMASQGANNIDASKPSKEALDVKVLKVSEFHGNYTIELSNGRSFTYSQRNVTHY